MRHILTKDFRYVQKEPSRDGSFDVCHTYVFFIAFTDRKSGKACRIKYVSRAEKIGEVFAIKFYASRDRKSIHDKYSLAHKQLSYKAVISIFDRCLEIIAECIMKYPESSFVFKGAEAYDPRTKKWEDEKENQRFRIYRSYLSKKIGTKQFSHFHFPDNSIYLLVKRDCEDDVVKKDRLMAMLMHRFMPDND